MSSSKKEAFNENSSKYSSIKDLIKQNNINPNALKSLINTLKEKQKLTSEEIIELLIKEEVTEDFVPISIFNNEELSALETIVKYLKENANYNFSKIASLLNRDQRTIWTTYHNSLKKRKGKLHIKDSEYKIPISIFSNRNFAVLELISEHLHDYYNLRFSEIALLLNRDQRTIWTTYQRIKKKESNAK